MIDTTAATIAAGYTSPVTGAYTPPGGGAATGGTPAPKTDSNQTYTGQDGNTYYSNQYQSNGQNVMAGSKSNIPGATAGGASYIGSSDQTRSNENDLTKSIQDMMNQHVAQGQDMPSYADALKAYRTAYDTNQQSILDDRTKNQAMAAQQYAGINADFGNQYNQLLQNQKGETGTQTMANARAGGYLGISQSGIGTLQQLDNLHNMQVADLMVKKQNALLAAQTAVQNQDYALAKESRGQASDYAKQITDAQNTHFAQNQQVLQTERETIKSSQDTQSFQTDQANKLSTEMAPAIYSQFGGDTTSKKAQAFIAQTAQDYGIDAKVLAGSIAAYTTKTNLDKYNSQGEAIKEYNFARGQGFSGSLLQYQAAKTQASQTLPTYGLAPDDPAQYVVLGLGSKIDKTSFLQNYAALKQSGNIQGAQKYLDTAIYENLPATDRKDFQAMTNTVNQGGQALAEISQLKGTQFNVYNNAIQQKLPLIGVSKDQQWVKAIQDLSQSNASILHNLYGARLTGTELGYGSQFLVDPSKDDLQTALTKQQGLVDYANQQKVQKFSMANGNIDTSTTPPANGTIKTGPDGKSYVKVDGGWQLK